MNLEKKYLPSDFAFIIPTKDRPEKIKTVLESIAVQTNKCKRIIVVDGGKSVKDIVMSFSNKIPVEYFCCYPPSQIKQRNLAICQLDEKDLLVGFLDDDLVLEPKALEEMIKLWNKVEANTAGISFNITNSPPFKHTWYKALIGMSSKNMGTVLRSGYNVQNSPTKNDIKSQWLCGGATVWKQEILKNNINNEIQSRWAICEDIAFSYPIGNKYPLYVCSKARVRHEHVFDHNAKVDYIYYGRTATLWRLYFVESNEQLSRAYFFYMILMQMVIRLANGIFFLNKKEYLYAIGQLSGLRIGLNALIKHKPIESVLEEETV
jgi:glycosyltransferase involved in cell wall biosynthesis